MDEDTSFCVNCLREVDPEIHTDCTLTFDNLLDAEERGCTETFQEKRSEATSQQQARNPSILEGGKEVKNVLKRKPDFGNAETPIEQTHETTSPRVLGAYNPGIQRPESAEYGNRTSRHNEDSRFRYAPSQTFYPENPSYSRAAYIGSWTGDTSFGNVTQRGNNFQNAQKNGGNPHYQQPLPVNYEQNYAKNPLQPYISDYRHAFPGVIPQKRRDAFGHMESPSHFDRPQLQNRNVSYEPHVIEVHPNSNTHVENYPENLKYPPGGGKHTAALNYVTRDKVPVNKEKNFPIRNNRPSPCDVSKTKIQNENRDRMDATEFLYWKNYHRRSQQENSAISTLQKNDERSAHQKNEMRSTPQMNAERNAYQKNEMRSTPQMNAERNAYQKNEMRSTPQMNAERNAHQNNEMRSALQLNAERSAYQKNEVRNTSENIIQRKGTEKSTQKIAESAHQKCAEKSAHQKNEVRGSPKKHAEKSVQAKHAEKSVQAKDAEYSVQAMDAKKGVQAMDAQYSVQEKDAEKKNVQAKDAEKSVQEKDAEKSVQEKDAEKSVQEKDAEKSVQKDAEKENTERFTGEGYKSIDEFIEALYNGTLYKRY